MAVGSRKLPDQNTVSVTRRAGRGSAVPLTLLESIRMKTRTTRRTRSLLGLLASAWILTALLGSCAGGGEGGGGDTSARIDAALESGDYNAAINLLSREINVTPDNAELNCKLGKAFLKLGEVQAANPEMGGDPGSSFTDAESCFCKALKLDPTLHEAQLGLASTLYMNSSFDEAITAAEEYLKQIPNDAKALSLAGTIGLKLAAQLPSDEGIVRIDASIKRFEKANELDPSLDKLYIKLGDACLQKNDIHTAADAYRKGIKNCPESNDVHSRLLYLNGREGGTEPGAAIAFYDSLLESQKKPSPAGLGRLWWFKGIWLSHKAMNLYKQEKYSLAQKAYNENIGCLKKCVEAYPYFKSDAKAQEAKAHLNRGWAFIKMDMLMEAEDEMFTALDHDPEDSNTIFAIDTLGFAVSQKNGLEGGLGFFKRLTSRCGSRHQWWNDYGYFSLETNMRSDDPPSKYRETFQIYQTALELKPDYPRYTNDSAMLLDYYLDPGGERKDEVEAMYKKAWKLGKEAHENPFTDEKEKEVHFSAYTDAMVNLGRMYLMLDRIPESRNMLEGLRAVSPMRWETVLLEKALNKDTPPEKAALYKRALSGKLSEEDILELQEQAGEKSSSGESD